MDFFVTNGKFLLERTNEQRESRAVYKLPPVLYVTAGGTFQRHLTKRSH